MIVYKTTNLINGKFYIGQDSNNNPEYIGSGTVLKQAIKKYGKENFKKEILEHCENQDHLNEREKYWIKKTNALRDGYNLAEGGFGVSNMSDEIKEKISKSKKGIRPSEETKRKRSLAMRGKTHTEETKRKLSEAHRGKKLSKEHRQKLRKAHLGKTLPDETKKKISEKSKLRKHSEKTKQKISKAHIGKKHSEETKRKIGEASSNRKISEEHKKILLSYAIGNQWNVGRKHTEEAKRKIAEASTGRLHSEKTKEFLSDVQKNRKEVCQIDPETNEIVNIYKSINKAHKATNINRSNIITCINHPEKRPQAGGYIWKVYTDQ